MSNEKIIQKIKDGTISRADRLKLYKNAKSYFQRGILENNPEEILRLIETISVPPLQQQYVFMGYCPGARGCTPQSCAYRDAYQSIREAGADGLYGLSSQDTAWQSELAGRLHLPFPVLSDAALHFATALSLPTFTVEAKTLIKRLTLIARRGQIEAVHYPVFPSDSDPSWVLKNLLINHKKV